MPFTVDAPVLEGDLVRLEPLSPEHAADLTVAAQEDRSGYRWTHVPRAGEVGEYLDAHRRRREAGTMLPFAQVRRADGRAVGCTSLWDPRSWPDGGPLYAVEIGWTWLAGSAQRSGINVEAKRLLMGFAFDPDGLAVERVDLKTDARNERSRRAITALGAQFEGVLRSWSVSHAAGEHGVLRDSAMFSVIRAEWPTVKAGLEARMARYRSG